VSSLTFLDPRPAKSGAHRPGIPAAGVGSPPNDYIAREKVFPGRFMQVSRDPAVKVVLGLQQQLRKFIKNRRKIIKIQNQFCWFRGEEIYLFQKTCIGFFCTVFELKIQTQFGVF
jgi:hypothetical protein